MAMYSMHDKCATIRCSKEAMKLLTSLEFVWEGEDDAFSCVTPWASFEYCDDENVGTLKLTPSFLECLCNGGYCTAFDNEHTLFTAAEHPIDYDEEEE